MKGLHRSFQRVEDRAINRIDSRRRKSLNRSADKVAKADRKRSDERKVALLALQGCGVLRIPKS